MVKQKHLEKRALIRLAVFGATTLIFVLFSLVGLTANSQGAKDRYDALIAVDEAGGDVEKALNELRGYIYSHMNTQIGSDLGVRPPIQLRGTYERLVAEQDVKNAQSNEDLYAEAQNDCELRNPDGFSGRGRTDCIAQYVDANGIEESAVVIEDALYKFDFVPPRWSADFAGVSILMSLVSGLAFSVELLLYYRTRHMVNMAN